MTPPGECGSRQTRRAVRVYPNAVPAAAAAPAAVAAATQRHVPTVVARRHSTPCAAPDAAVPGAYIHVPAPSQSAVPQCVPPPAKRGRLGHWDDRENEPDLARAAELYLEKFGPLLEKEMFFFRRWSFSRAMR